MNLPDSETIARNFQRDGFYFPLDVMDSDQATEYRRELETIEQHARKLSDPEDVHILFANANSVLPFVDEICRLPALLEAVKAVLGPDLLVWNAGFFIKESHTPDFVSWHQDLRYWGLSDTEEVTAWVALSRADRESGCMRFVPGTHELEIQEHADSFADTNMLSRGQELAVKVDESQAVDAQLEPGQMSLHHGHMFHASHPNHSNDRRIGLAIRYITPSMQQLDDVKAYAHLVAGNDHENNFHLLDPPRGLLHPDDIDIVKRNLALQDRFFYGGVVITTGPGPSLANANPERLK